MQMILMADFLVTISLVFLKIEIIKQFRSLSWANNLKNLRNKYTVPEMWCKYPLTFKEIHYFISLIISL